MTQLKSINITDFRSIRGSITVPLDAPVVLIHGQNGAGKTSLLSAIELALTGHVPSLQRVDPTYVSHLVHKSAQSSHVSIDANGLSTPGSRAEISITRQGVVGQPLLNPSEARFYSERCFLAQATLGRLLELYEYKDARKSDSPLTAFVKDLLGLDQLDALIDGLFDAGDVRRFRSVVPLYWETRENIPSLEADIRAREAELLKVRSAEGTVLSRIASRLERHGLSELIASDAPEILRRLNQSTEEGDLQRLASQRREILALRQQWQSIQSGSSRQERATVEHKVGGTATELEAWRSKTGKALEEALAVATNYFPDLPASSSVGPHAAITAALQSLRAELVRCSNELVRSSDDQAKLAALSQDIERAKARALVLSETVAEHAGAAGELAKILSEVLAHIHSDDCPVCGRDFGETASIPLHAHVSHRIRELTDSAGKLQALTREQAATSSAQASAERERVLIASRQLDDKSLDQLKRRLAHLTELLQLLESLESEAAEGQRLMAESAAAARAVGEFQADDHREASVRETTHRLVSSLLPDSVIPNETIETVLDRLATLVANKEEQLSNRQAARRESAADAQEAITLRAQRVSIETAIGENLRRVVALTKQQAAADAVIKDARELARRARDARTKIVRRVFNEALNTIWRDLFVRLAPEEPFLPAFALPPNDGGPVEAALETLYKSGGTGGNPRAMLSAGNLNTAALTLFLALHLSVSPILPWLVIDDPVQSMDEVHIAQFAALLRTLSKVHKRQVVISVHERPLFDYLSLELSPAFRGDRLITIELSRNADGETLMEYQPLVWQPDTAIAA